MRQANVYNYNVFAGILTEDENGYTFEYNQSYMDAQGTEPISLTMPYSSKQYNSMALFPFFDGLIPEGWLLDIAQRSWKIDRRDRMSLLLACCKDCIGSVSVVPIEIEELL